MARSHARVFTVIWDDPDFLALTGLAQRCYMMLLSQPNLGHAGLLSTTFRRWTLLCADEDEERLRTAIAELTECRFIVVDERTEELLVRSLVRNDGVWKQPKVLAVAISEAASIRSALLRASAAEELARIDCTELPPATRPAVEALLKDLPQRLANARLDLAAQDPPHPPADPPPHPPAQVGANGDADVLRVRAGAAPTPATVPIPSPVPPPAAGKPAGRGQAGLPLPDMPDEPPESPNQRANRLTRIFAELRPVSNFNAAAGIVRKAVNATHPDDVIEAGLRKVVADGMPLTAETLRQAIEGPPKPARSGRGGASDPLTDQRYGEGSTDI